MDTEAQKRFKKHQADAERLLSAIAKKIKMEEQERKRLKDQTGWEGVGDMAHISSRLMDIATFLGIPGARSS